MLPITEETLRVPCSIDQHELLHSFVNRFCRQQNIPRDTTHAIWLALDELFSNICKFAYGDQAGFLFVQVTLRIFEQKFEWSIEDEGIPFNPLSYPSPSTGVDLEDMLIGGQGIHLVKQFTDELYYERQGTRNRLVGRKTLHSPRG